MFSLKKLKNKKKYILEQGFTGAEDGAKSQYNDYLYLLFEIFFIAIPEWFHYQEVGYFLP